ncbi:MAG: TonB-dependent receptor [Muribaculaceae bacterium]|nr:TonB-dependent receptor [Muribaculaceae bacterium]
MQKRQCFLKLWSLAALLCLSYGNVYAADVPEPQASTSSVKGAVTKVTGTVIDELGEGIPGASVKLVGGSKGAITDIDGSFTIEVPKGSKLEISFLGYTPETIVVGDQSSYTIELRPQSEMLDEVVAVALGTQKKESVIGAISTIDASSLKVPVGNLSSAIAGKIAGAVVMQRTSEPGSSADFWIRGISSFGANNRPLVLVDGIERSMDLVDPEDIQSFSILKDATATALYGVRGANGIVLITTKRGTESKPKVTAKVEYGFTNPVKIPEMANAEQFIDFYNDITLDATGALAFDPATKAMYLNGTDPDLYPNVDWVNTIFKDHASTTRVNVSVSGGTPTVRYYVGGSFYREGSILNAEKADTYDANMNYTKYNFRANVDINITKSTELGLSLANLYSTKNRPYTALSTIYTRTLQTTPIATPIKYSDGTLALPKNGQNPWYDMNQTGYAQEFSSTSQAQATLTQDFSDFVTPGLKANIKFAWDAAYYTTVSRYKNPAVFSALGRDENGDLIFESRNQSSDYLQLAQAFGNTSYRSTSFEASLVYDRTFDRVHQVSGMFNFNMRSLTYTMPGSYERGFPYRNTGIAGRATYSYDSRYFVEFNFGYNGSENFSPKKRFGFFPSYALGYVISNEKFWEPLTPYISLMKFKASYGEIGNDQIGGDRRFAFNTTMVNGTYGFNWGTNPITSNPSNGVATGIPGNDDVSWEKAIKKNIGIELGFLNSSVNLQVDYFYEKRSGIFILQQSVPTVVGNNVQQYVNLGRMRNQGIDATAEYNKQFGDFLVSARGTFTYNRNRKVYDDAPTPIYPYLSAAGFPYLQDKGLIALGLFESEEDIANSPRQTFGAVVRPGDIKYKDINGDNIIDSNDKVAIGYSQIPEISYGFGASVMWKGIDLSVFFQGVGHITRILNGPGFWGQGLNMLTTGQIFSEVADNRWSLDNPDPNAMYPRLAVDKIENNQQASTYWQRDCSFIRLKNAEIGYTFPKKWFEKAGISNVRLYVSGNNLLTWSKFKLWDPELESVNGQKYPQMRSGAVGLNVNF